jgi:hypothetical protein
MSADVGDASVEDNNLPMVAFVHYADVAHMPRMIFGELAARLDKSLLGLLAHLFRSSGIQHQPHGESGTAAFAQYIGQTLPELAVLPKIRFEVHSALRRTNIIEHDVEEAAILEDFDRIACDLDAVRKSSHRIDERFERYVAVHAQMRIAMPLDRPDKHNKQDNNASEDSACDSKVGVVERHGRGSSVKLAESLPAIVHRPLNRVPVRASIAEMPPLIG